MGQVFINSIQTNIKNWLIDQLIVFHYKKLIRLYGKLILNNIKYTENYGDKINLFKC